MLFTTKKKITASWDVERLKRKKVNTSVLV
jgi:hypothetical protein